MLPTIIVNFYCHSHIIVEYNHRFIVYVIVNYKSMGITVDIINHQYSVDTYHISGTYVTGICYAHHLRP